MNDSTSVKETSAPQRAITMPPLLEKVSLAAKSVWIGEHFSQGLPERSELLTRFVPHGLYSIT